MIEFEDACEIASCHFGLNGHSSCLSRAWDLGEEWLFEPSYGERKAFRTLERVSVSKKNGQIGARIAGVNEKEITDRIPKKFLV